MSPESGTLYAVHANNGSILWQFPMDGVPEEGQMNNGVLYVPLRQKDTSLINALRASDGKHLWQKQFNSGLGPGFAVADEAIYINTGTDPNFIYPPPTSTVYALRPSDGTPLWSYQKKQGTISRLVVKDGVVYFSTIEGNTGGSACAYQASNGTPIWCHQTEVGVAWFEVG